MSMNDPLEVHPAAEILNWLQDQVGQLRAQVGRIGQQGDQVQAAILDLNEKQRDAEGRMREFAARTVGLPTMQ